MPTIYACACVQGKVISATITTTSLLTSVNVGTDEITIKDVEDHVSSEDHVRSCDNTEEQLLREKLSNLELENNLLRDEVKLLNTELADANKRVKEIHECQLISLAKVVCCKPWPH